MHLPDLVILALVEGVADALPVDATAHSLLASKVLGWRAGSIGVAVHLGTALALLVYLWREIRLIGLGLLKLRKGRIEPGTRLLTKALLAAAPWIVATSVLNMRSQARLSDMLVVGITTVICALFMGVVDRMCMTVKRTEHMGGITALLVGLAQVAAVLPGVGRVAAALTAARLLGVERPAAYRFVLLANIPILLAASGGDGLQYLLHGVRPSSTDLLAIGLTFVLVLASVSVAMSWIQRLSLAPFAVYRMVIGLALVGLSLL